MMRKAVLVEPDETAARIRSWLRQHPEIAKDKYDAEKGSVEGHCYLASELFFYANGGEDSELNIHCLSWDNGDTHWYLSNDIVYLDLSIPTMRQAIQIPHEKGRTRAFLTGYEPSQRAETVNDALGLW